MDIADQAWSSTPTMDRRLGDVHFDDIVAARRLLSRMLTPTPLVTHPLLSKRIGAEVHVKLENAVPLGSFKLRGGLNLRRESSRPSSAPAGSSPPRAAITGSRWPRRRSVIGCLARCSCPPATIRTRTRPSRRSALRVTIAGHDFDAAWQAAQEYADRTGAIAVHPSREPQLIAGYATVALEMLDQASQPLDTVFVPVGGGSLAAGMGLVFKALSPHTRIIGVQSAAAPALARAWHTGEMREVPVGETIADGLATRVPSPDTRGDSSRSAR